MNAVVYVRVSTEEQVENYSLATQQRACEEYCERRSFTVDRVFREEGASAKTAARPVLKSMINYCVTHKPGIDLMVVHRMDRLARNLHDHHMIKAALAKVGIKVKSVLEDFDDSAAGRFIENVLASAAQFDNDVRSSRTIDAMRAGLSDGRWMWGAPIGYRRGGGKAAPSLVLDDASAPLVQLAFELYAKGDKTKREIWERVTELGLNRSGKQLSLQSFGEMLKNPIYRGRIVSEALGFDGEADFEPLVSDELWNRVQRVSDRRRTHKPQKQWDHPDFPLRRVVHCWECNTPLTASWSTGRSKKYPYYRCPRRQCGGVNVRKEALEEEFLRFLSSLNTRPEVLDLTFAIVRDAWSERVRAASDARQLIERRMTALEAQKQKLLEAFVYENRVDQDTYGSEKHRIEDSLRDLAGRLKENESVPDDIQGPLDHAATLMADLASYWNHLNHTDKPGFVRAMFPAGLWFTGESIGTTELPWILLPSHQIEEAEEGRAVPTGFEPAFPA